MKDKTKKPRKKIQEISKTRDKDKLKSLADFTSENPQPSLRVGKDGIILYANAASLPIISDWEKRIGQKVSGQWHQLIKEVLQSGIRENIEVECKGRIYSFIVVPVRLSSYVNLYGRDITEKKNAEERLHNAYQALKETQSNLIQAEKMNVVGTLASGIAHEVKNPLATILQGIEFLSKNPKSKKENISSVLTSMEDAVKRADEIVKGLLDFSRVSALNLKKEDLHVTIERAFNFIKHQANKNNVNVIKDFAKKIPSLNIDRNKIVQVFVNLFLNAIQAMPFGGELKIKTYSKKQLIKRSSFEKRIAKNTIEIEETFVIVEIEDTGTGIPKSAMDKLFDPFFTTNRAKGGTGLGLSIVLNILDMHNGKLTIENKKDKGARATITFKI